MKKVEAIIKPFSLDEVKQALADIGVTGLTASEIRGFGRQPGRSASSGSEYAGDFHPKVKLEVVVAEAMVGKVIEAVERVARTGRVGDGKVFVTPVGEAIRVRTGERGEGAL